MAKQRDRGIDTETNGINEKVQKETYTFLVIWYINKGGCK